jgi:hypothetical protein
MPVLADFMQCLGSPDAPGVALEADRSPLAVDTLMKDQGVTSEDRVWVVNEIPDPRYFARYVVGLVVAVPAVSSLQARPGRPEKGRSAQPQLRAAFPAG